MAKFKSTYNGFVIQFTNENDIAELRKHHGYVEVVEDALGKKESTGCDPAREVHTSPVPSPDREQSMPAKTRVRGKRKG